MAQRTFTFQDMKDQIAEARQSGVGGYGRVYIVIPWEEEEDIEWGMCGDNYVTQGLLSREYEGKATVVASPFLLPDTPDHRHRAAIEWLAYIRSAIGEIAWEQMYIPSRGGQVLNQNAKKKDLSVS